MSNEISNFLEQLKLFNILKNGKRPKPVLTPSVETDLVDVLTPYDVIESKFSFLYFEFNLYIVFLVGIINYIIITIFMNSFKKTNEASLLVWLLIFKNTLFALKQKWRSFFERLKKTHVKVISTFYIGVFLVACFIQEYNVVNSILNHELYLENLKITIDEYIIREKVLNEEKRILANVHVALNFIFLLIIAYPVYTSFDFFILKMIFS
jgi:hypothetical protein